MIPMLNINDILNISDSFIHLEEFVDRTVETNQFQVLVDKRYDERDPHKRIIAFYGQAGIGKTMLLDRLEFECIRMKIPYSRITFETGTYNNTIEILREMVRELDPKAFINWTQLDQFWFSSELDVPEWNIKVRGQEAGVSVSAENVNVSGDVVAGSKVEIRNNIINVSTRAALDPLEAQVALTDLFIKALGEFVQERSAVILFEGLDHEYCSAKIRNWVNGLLDRIRVLKGFGVLPVVTYVNIPNFEAKLRSVTLSAELKPLTQEHVVEYFRARQIPENIIMDAASSCIEETLGIPARVYEYVENIISALEEETSEIPDQSDESVVAQIQEIPEQPREVKAMETLQEIQEQPLESTVVEDEPASVAEPVEAVQEAIPFETIVEEPAMIEQKADDVSVPPVFEEQGIAETSIHKLPKLADEPLEAVLPKEKTSEDSAQSVEAVQAVQEEAKADSEVEPLIQETSLIESEPDKVEKSETELIEPQESPEPVPQPVDEKELASEAETMTQEVPNIPDVETPVKAETIKSEESPKQVQPPTPEDAKRSEEAFRRSQERLKRLKSEGKSSTAHMVDSRLGRQKDQVADAARRCAVLRWFTVDLIEVIADQELGPEQAAEILATISSWPFVENFGYGTYAYRREVQQYLRTQMQNDDPQLYTEINRRAQVYFEKQLGLSDTIDDMIWVNLQKEQVDALRENLYYLLNVDVTRGFDLLGKLFQSAQRLYLTGEAAILLKFANEIDKSTLSERHRNQLDYYEAVLKFSEGEAPSAESKLLTLMKKVLEDELRAQVQSQLGVIYAADEKYDQAIKVFEQALKIWQQLKREREWAILSNNLGNVYKDKKDLKRAERSLKDALKILEKAGTPSEIALTLNNLGNVQLENEKFSKALEYYQKSLEIKTSIGDQFGAANTHFNLGTVHQRMAQDSYGKKQAEQRQLAVDYYTRSLEAYRAFGARSNQGKLLYKLAYLYFQAGDKAKAGEYLPDALDIFRDLEMPDLEKASNLEKMLA
jgi:tetratricopeptide (TPR) repeat protein